MSKTVKVKQCGLSQAESHKGRKRQKIGRGNYEKGGKQAEKAKSIHELQNKTISVCECLALMHKMF